MEALAGSSTNSEQKRERKAECAFPACGRIVLAKGLCGGHYAQRSRGYELRPLTRTPGRRCEVPGCEKPHRAKGLCRSHYGEALAEINADVPRPDESTLKRCTKCGESKALTEFHRCRNNVSTGRTSHCRSCNRASSRENSRARRAENPVAAARYARDWALRKQYRITLEQYEEMVRRQRGLCAICNRTDSAKGMLYVDHDHASGKVRGLLCNQCNFGLGQFQDSIERLRAAARYLKAAA